MTFSLDLTSNACLISSFCRCSFGSGEEDGEESFDDSDARRKLAEYQGSTAASASVNSERQANNRDGLTDSEEDGAPQDEQHQAVEAAAAAAAAAGLSPYIQNGQVRSAIGGLNVPSLIQWSVNGLFSSGHSLPVGGFRFPLLVSFLDSLPTVTANMIGGK